MRHLIYKTRQHLSTVFISLSIGLLMGGGGAYAAAQMNFSQVKGKVSTEQIQKGAVDYNQLSLYVREFIDNCHRDCASNLAMNEAIGTLRTEIAENYVHKP